MFEHDPMVNQPILHVLDGSGASITSIDLITLRSERTASTTTASNPEITASVNSVESFPEPIVSHSLRLYLMSPHIHATGVDGSNNVNLLMDRRCEF